MPASETFWRPLKKMHVIFAVSSIALALVTFWMLADDYASEWRGHQQMVDKLNALKLRQSLKEETGSQSYKEEKSRLDAEIKEANKTLAAREKETAKLKLELQRLALDVKNSEREARSQRAERDKLRADYDLAVRDELPEATLAERFDDFTAAQAEVERLEKAAEAAKAKHDAVQARLNEIGEDLAQLEAQRNALATRSVQLEESLQSLEPDDGFASIKRTMLDWPILDGFSQVHRIQLDWLPDLHVKLGMASTARFDRCRTCHLSIDRVETGNVPTFPYGEVDSRDPADWVAENKFPHPYATHPRPELYLTAASPHPLQTFGCTICHDGQGSATNFNNAQHGPNNPHVEAEWEEKYGHHYNHFWEYPMLPQRFRESSCLKCHHSVVELGVNPEFGPSAPKLYRGYQLIQKYGCFGCHEIHGFSAGESIGPDLRLEPGYNAAAQQLLHQLDADKSTAGKTVAEIRRLANEVAENPADTADKRNELRNLILVDRDTPSPLLSKSVHAMADAFKDVDVPGRYRKVGPSLRHVAAKTTPAWIEYWTEEPKRFRPTTRMPQFFHNTNQQDAHAAELMPVELTAIAEYVINNSQKLDLLSPPPIEVDGESKPYEPDAARGKDTFAKRGCLACHSHKDFPEISADFGPDLSRVHEKIRPGAEGFQWLYTWLRDPKRHHPRTKMPNLFLTQRQEGDVIVDPAADIAAYLLEGEPGEYKRYPDQGKPYLGLEVDPPGEEEAGLRIARVMPLSPASRAYFKVEVEGDKPGEKKIERRPASIRFGDLLRTYNGKAVSSPAQLDKLVAGTAIGSEVPIELFNNGTTRKAFVVIGDPLDDMVRLFLTKAIGIQPTETFLKTRVYPGNPDQIKGDEIELVAGETPQALTAEQWRTLKLNYVGRRTISRYGCYGCHDIPGFEEARPIGTTLQDWGRKDTTKLALEHIEEYLHHHGEPNGSSTHDRVEQALKNARAGGLETDEFPSAEVADREMSAASLYENLMHHRRDGFLWQKLRQPRSYDYRKIETKGYDERLRMPKFPFSEADIEDISTFVLGLTAEPPAEQYIYKPAPRAHARIEGEFLLEKYNCAGCHMLDLPQAAFALQSDDPAHPYREMVGWTAEEIAEWFVDNRGQLLSGGLNPEDYPDDVKLMQNLGAPIEEIVQLTNDDTISNTDTNGLEKLAGGVSQWLAEHPQYLLAAELKPGEGETPAGIARLLALKPPVKAYTGKNREDGSPILSFHGLLMEPPDLEEDPEFQAFNYRTWETLDVGGRILLPNYNITKFRPDIEFDMMQPSRGGDFALWLVERLAADRSSKASGDRGWAWSMSPPPLYLEGIKVQTPWLYKFLKNPHVIRYETVLRMPRFNLDDNEARSLADYFAAVDDSEFPYQGIPQREPAYLDRKNSTLAEDIPDDSTYLSESWKLLNANVCIGCHSVGGKPFASGPGVDPTKVTHGPDLNRAHERLRPDWLALWLTKPPWITPYTKMLIPKAEPSLLGGERPVQMEALRDALLNYPLLLEQDGAIFYDPKTQTVKPASEAEAAPTDAAPTDAAPTE